MSDPEGVSQYLQAILPPDFMDDDPPGSVCQCGSDNVDITNGEWECNECGAFGTIRIVVEKIGIWDKSTANHGDGSRWEEL